MERISFPLPDSITYETVLEAHKRILRIAVETRNILEHHNIPYSLFFGSVIGAVRHKGFIPWDMDMDMGVFDDYENVVAILKKELPSWLIVLDNTVDPNYCASWVKIVDRFSDFRATTFSSDNILKYRGLHVDLYKITRTSYNHACRYRKDEAIDYYKRRLHAGLITEQEFNESCSKVENNYKLEEKRRKPLQVDKPVYAFLKFFEGEEDTIFPLRRYEFEGECFWGPSNYDSFLRNCYYKGDYMELPPFEKRDMKMDEIILNPIVE